jgi:outer membrane protein assembly factor BamB
MKKLPLFALTSLLFAISVQAQVGPEQARNYQINETHTGAINVSGVQPPLKQKWSRNFGQDMSYPLIVDGKVYVTVRYASVFGTELYALNAANGATLWSYPLGGSANWSAICYENGRVFALNNSGLLRAIDGDTGNVIWSRQLFGTNFTSAPTVFQGVIYIGGSANGTAHAVSAETGNVLWSATLGAAGNTTAAVTNDGVYLSYSCVNANKLNPADGSLIWRNYLACGSGSGRAAAVYNGRVYARTPSSNSDWIYYSQEGGLAGDFISKSAPAFSGNTGFFLNGNKFGPPQGNLEARDLTTNAVLWTFIGDGLLQSSILVVNDYVYIGSGAGKLYALKASNGEEVWSTTAGTSIPVFNEQTSTQPMTGFAAGEGILVVPTKTTLVAYETDYSPTITWGSPIPAPNSLGWHHTPVQLPFTAVARPPSGLAFATPESPLQFNNEGDNQTQQVSVIDQVGNTATLTSPLLRIDLTAPVTNSAVAGTIAPGTQWYRDSAQVTLTRTDNLSGLQLTSYTIDGGLPQPYGSPFTIRTDGSHTLNYWSSDRAGNIETQQSRVINVDVSAPVTQISTGSGFYASPTEVTLTATDSASGVANTFYQYAFGPTQTYSGPFTATGDGPQSVVFWSADSAGHVENQHSVTLWLDGSAPSTAIAISGTASNGWRNTPVQITLSPTDARSGVAASYYTVDGGPTQTYSGPFTVDGSAVHQVSYWSVDNVGNTEVQKSTEVKIDKDAPTTASSLSGTLGNNDYYKGSVQVTLTATDNLSGVASSATSYTIDNSIWTTYPGSPITVSGNGTHTMSFSSKDIAGNFSAQTTITIKIDAAVPVTQATLAGTQGNGGWYTNEPQVTLSATDTPSGVETTFYTIDGGSQQTYSAPFNISNSGFHTLIYWSVDRAGNTESQRSLLIKVDSVAPSSQAQASSTWSFDVWYQSPAQVYISATDNASGIANTYYTLDGGATQTYTAAFNISTGGVHIVNYWSVDQAGNTEAQKSFTVRVDSAAPTTQIATAGTGANGWYRGPVQVSLTATDPEVGVNVTMYRVDGGLTMIYSGTPFTVTGEGQHTVLYWSNDKLNHTETQNSATIRIDSTVPTVQNSFSGPLGGNGYYIGPVQFTMTGTDNLSGLANIYYRVNGGATLVYSSPFAIGVDGNHSIDYWSVDVAGNVSGAGNALVKIDVSAPLTQATGSGPAGTNGWYRSAVQVALSAADNLSGVQTTSYKVDGGTTKTYTTAFSVTGNGSHTVNFWSVDKATNTETMGSLAVNIDSTLPGVTCNVSPASSTKSSNPVTITVTGHATDTVSGVSITDGATFSVVDEYGVTQPGGPITLQSNGNYSFTLTLPATKNVGDSSHVYTITVRGTDRAGNTSTASDTLKIN